MLHSFSLNYFHKKNLRRKLQKYSSILLSMFCFSYLNVFFLRNPHLISSPYFRSASIHKKHLRNFWRNFVAQLSIQIQIWSSYAKMTGDSQNLLNFLLNRSFKQCYSLEKHECMNRTYHREKNQIENIFTP